MSTTTTTIYSPLRDPPIPIHLPAHIPPLLRSTIKPGPSADTTDITTPLLTHPPFDTWLRTLLRSLARQHTTPTHPFHASPYTLRAITINHIDVFGGAKLGFINLHAEIANAEGETLPGVVFLRGGSVGILVLVYPDGEEEGEGGDDSNPLVVLVQQPRVPAGSLGLREIPAGMIDAGSARFSGAAAKELHEELGLTIDAEDLVDLCALAGLGGGDVGGVEGDGGGMFPSPGGSDEHVTLFAYVVRGGGGRKDWEGKVGGVREEGERIVCTVVEGREVWRATRDMKTLAAWALWEGLRREGKVGRWI